MADNIDDRRLAETIQRELRGHIPQLEMYIAKAEKTPNQAATAEKMKKLTELLKEE